MLIERSARFRCKRNCVVYWTSLTFGTAAEAVTPVKQRKVASRAVEYLARKHVTHRPCRFDVVAIDFAGTPRQTTPRAGCQRSSIMAQPMNCSAMPSQKSAAGKGVAKDLAKAVEWYRRGADQGDAPSQAELGQCYELGKGVAVDLAEALRWYEAALENGLTDVQPAIARVKKAMR